MGRIVVLSGVLLVAACSTVGERAARMEGATCAADVKACLSRIMDVHGGLSRFRAMRYARYEIDDVWSQPMGLAFNPWPGHATRMVYWSDRTGTDGSVEIPETGHVVGMDAFGTYSVGNKPGVSVSAGKYAQGTSWVMALPFRLADDDVEVQSVTPERWRHRNVVAVHFRAKVGWTPRDEWVLYVEPQSLQMAGARFWASEHQLWLDVQFTGFVVVGGLLVPSGAQVDVVTPQLPIPLHTLTLRDVKLWSRIPDEFPKPRPTP
ncbi:MAG: hypothetical protein AB2A00_40920 [Myxococcota bacterium]